MKKNCLSSPAAGFQFRRKAVAFGVALALVSPAYSNPTGLSVVAGQATAQTIGNLMQITNTPGAILNWQQFNVDVGQTTQFIQQNAASQVFNRVTGGDVSQILGSLQSNGQVFLINPAGVFFGQGAVVDTAGFLASTLAASDTDLLKGHLRFEDAMGTAGSIVNQGKLTTHSGGSIVLLAPSIENSGIVHANGEVLLVAGHSVTIVDLKHPTIGLTVAVKAGEQAVNLGHIISKNASLFSHLVKNSGVVEATGVEVGKAGVIRFTAQGGDALVGGKVLAESATGQGGKIDITGERVAILDGARISADGATGGGTVHVGGGWMGQDASIANAKQTVVQSNSTISANATGNGNGGEVVVWADGSTVVNSEVQAKGGALGGNGGRVETSGKQTLAVNVAANTSAPKGNAGQWLIDPANLTIVDQIPEGEDNLQNSSQGPFFSTDDISASFSPTDSYLLASTVVDGLENNGSVRILTTGDSSGTGNLTIDTPVLVSQNLGEFQLNPELFLEAKGAIKINAAVGLMPGQPAFQGFDLLLSYDIAKPVYIDAPLYLGATGNLTLAPYEAQGGSQLPVNTEGQLPVDGVNFLSGMNAEGSTGPLVINRIKVSSAVAVDSSGEAALLVSPGKPVKLNILGADLEVDQIDAFGNSSTPETDIRVGKNNFDVPAPVEGKLAYNFLNANSLTVDEGSTVSTVTRFDPLNSMEAMPATFLNRLVNSGTVNFNGGYGSIAEIQANASSTINLVGGFLQYGSALLNGSFNLQSGTNSTGSLLSGVDTDLNGSLHVDDGFNAVYLQSLGMGSASQIRIGSGGFLSLGRNLSSSFSQMPVLPKQEGATLSSTNGQFVVQQGAKIIMDGAASPAILDPLPVQTAQSIPLSGVGGARFDITGLDGRLDAPVIIESNGFLNAIFTGSENFDSNSESQNFFPINTMLIESADIRVNAGGAGQALHIGEFGGSMFYGGEGNSAVNGFLPTVDLDFRGSLTVNSGQVRLQGANVSTTGGNLNVNGLNAQIELAGRFTSADLFAVNRSNGGQLAARGFWDNSAVTSANAATSAPLAKGDILIGDELIVAGGLLSSAGTANSLKVAPDGFLLLRNTELSTTINLAPTAALMLGLQDESGNPAAPVVLNGATINMGGDSFLVVETNTEGVANLDGTATVTSGKQGNLILAGRRVFGSESIGAVPDNMTLNVGSGIRLNVTGNEASLPPALEFYYSQQETSPNTNRPVFLVGELTPEAVAIVEFESFNRSPVSTILDGFENPSFVVDGTHDLFTEGTPNCVVNHFCVKLDVAQTLNYSGMLMTTLGAPQPTLANSGVTFVAGANLTGLQFAVSTPDEIMFMMGLNNVTAADLVSGKRLVNAPGSTVRLGSNSNNETITNDLQNNGALELQGNYTLSGLLSGTGSLNNSGTLLLNNGTGSLISNSIVNTGTLSNAGSYSFDGVLTGLGSFVNSGVFGFTGSGVFENSVLNTTDGVLNFNGLNQNIQFASSFINESNVQFNGGQFAFSTTGFNQSSGNIVVQPGTTLVGNVNINGGALRGFATISGNLNAGGGRLAPGSSPGLMTVSGDLTLNAASVVDIEIQSDGGMPGVDFDCIQVSGTANLGGQLNLLDISGGELAAGNEYAFLKANAINGTFGSVSYSPASTTYNFSAPVVSTASQAQQLSTSTVALSLPPSTPVPPETITQSTGTADSSVGQNLNQAFTPPPSTTEPDSPVASTSSQQTQQTREDEAVEAASQSTAGTTISQQSNDIELKTTQSDPQRASAVCK